MEINITQLFANAYDNREKEKRKSYRTLFTILIPGNILIIVLYLLGNNAAAFAFGATILPLGAFCTILFTFLFSKSNPLTRKEISKFLTRQIPECISFNDEQRNEMLAAVTANPITMNQVRQVGKCLFANEAGEYETREAIYTFIKDANDNIILKFLVKDGETYIDIT